MKNTVALTKVSGLGRDLANLRLRAGLKQSKVAKAIGVDTSRVSRIETGEIIPEVDEVQKIAKTIGSAEAKEYAEFHAEPWDALEKPPYWHPARAELKRAEAYLRNLNVFLGKSETGESAKAQGRLHRETLLNSISYLQSLDHLVAFVGNIGVGKTTAICGISNLLLLPDHKGPNPLSKRVVLETGTGRMTLCEVQIRSGGKSEFGIIIQPHSDEEVFRTVSDFCAALVDAPANSENEARGVSEEVGKAIRNMADLVRKQTQGPDGKIQRLDPAIDLVKKCNSNLPELTAEVIRRLRLDQRRTCEFRFEDDDLQAGLKKLRQLFAGVNKGQRQDVSLPRRIDIVAPSQVRLLGKCPYHVSIIDTKGVDETAIRPDIRAYLDDPRTFTVLCSRFCDAPDTTMQLLVENIVNTGAERVLAERVVLLVLARSQEVGDTQDDMGNRAESPEEAYRIKEDQIRAQLHNTRGADKMPVVFFDVATDDNTVIAKALTQQLERMRAIQTQRIGEVGRAIDELIKRHDEAQTKAAHSQVRRQLKIFVERHRDLSPQVESVHEQLVNVIARTHARTVWATTRRNGAWSGLDAYHFLGVGTVVDAQRRSQAVFSGLDELLKNMLADDVLSPARDYISELLRNVPVWREKFLAQATSAGREHFKVVMYPDDTLWQGCVEFWGQGGGYRDRVAARIREWCDSQSSVHESVERTVLESWKETFLLPLRALCEASDVAAN